MSNSKNTSFDLVELIKSSSPDELKEGIKDVDLRTIDKKTIDNVIKAFLSNEITSTLQKIYILVANPKGGIDVNSSFKGYYIIMFFLHSKSKPEQFRDLVEKYGANINVKYESNDTLLTVTIRYRNIELAKVLIENGADVNEKVNNYGYMKELYDLTAYTHKIEEFYKLFLTHGIDIDQIIDNESKYTSLMLSIFSFISATKPNI